MLRWRLLLGALLIAAMIGLCWLDAQSPTPGVWLFPLALAMALLASNEMLWLLSARNIRPIPFIVYLGNVAIVCANWLPRVVDDLPALGPLGWPTAALALAAMTAFLGEMARYTGPGSVSERLSGAILALVYVGLFLTFVIQVRFVGSSTVGIVALASLVIVVKMCDTGAYTVGRLIGKHKMAPVLSPGKTLEGAAGGVAFAVIGSWLALGWLLPQATDGAMTVSILGMVGYGVAVGLAGMAGDLAESLLKRDLGRKDSSSWMPGFGGVLDVLDSILFAAPVAWLGWLVLLATQQVS